MTEPLQFRIAAPLLRFVCFVCFVGVLFLGCANVTTTIVRKNPDGSFSISSGKDVVFGHLSYSTNGLVISNYSANANVSAIQAQSARETALIKSAAEGFGQVGGQLFRTGVGLPK